MKWRETAPKPSESEGFGGEFEWEDGNSHLSSCPLTDSLGESCAAPFETNCSNVGNLEVGE